jgi:hypothetical protein
MAKKAKRRPFRRWKPQQRTEDAALERGRMEAAAESLLATRTPEQLKQELSERQWLLDEADRAAQLEPNPANLSRYRLARSQYNTAQVAMELLASKARMETIAP